MANTTKKRQTRKGSKSAKASKAKAAESSPTVVNKSFREIFADLFGSLPPDYEPIVAFRKLNDEQRVKASRKIIQDSIIDAITLPDERFPLAIAESETLLKGYATLDEQHRAEIQKLIEQITAYLRDSTRKRPFNALMLAAPGAGKSHFIKQLANSMKKDGVQAVTFNMATMQSADDMAQPIDELRNLKVNDRFPLLFLDEFDSDPSRYAALLPLLWDGELQIGHRDLKLGKAVIVLAGSNPGLPKAMDQSAKMRLEADTGEGIIPTGKLIDLLSRINGGVINIPDLDLRSERRDRRVDKVCVAISLIKARFGQNINEVPRSLLRFIAQTAFRYGVRSIAHLIDVIESAAFENEALKGDALGIPIKSEKALQESSLRLHLLDKDQGFGIVNRWKEFSEDKVVVNVRESPFQYMISS
ncbi:MAG: hypothetical protein QOH63_304 [Acidobacteriota bacterium]|jgi:DNA replication protein DnaC|nr:hypothetical protein [Acidobacteriota bacterium]